MIKDETEVLRRQFSTAAKTPSNLLLLPKLEEERSVSRKGDAS
jgi:hypothetical protein